MPRVCTLVLFIFASFVSGLILNSLYAYIAMHAHSAHAELLLPCPNHAWEVRGRCTPELNSQLIGSSRCAEV